MLEGSYPPVGQTRCQLCWADSQLQLVESMGLQAAFWPDSHLGVVFALEPAVLCSLLWVRRFFHDRTKGRAEER